MGLDGATFKNLTPWMEEGLLPNLKFLVENGASGELESTIPRLSSPAWTSFMTGVNPGKHGIFAFFKAYHDKRFGKELVTSTDIKAKTVMEILSEYGKICVSVNLPMTYPPFKINGVMVGCGLTTPSTDFDFTYPNDLLDKIGIKKSDYILNIEARYYAEDKYEGFFRDLTKETEQKKEVGLKLMEYVDWDFLTIVFGGTDRLHHFYWHHIDKTHSRYNPQKAEKIRPFIIDYYKKLDSIVGEFINKIDEQTSIFIMSDHGFGNLEKKVAIDNILKRNKLLVPNNSSLKRSTTKTLHLIRGFLNQNLFLYRKLKSLIKIGREKFQKRLLKKIISKKRVEKRLSNIADGYWQKINWKKTLASKGISDNSVYLNLAGRNPEGIIKTEEKRSEVSNKIIAIIKNLKDPETKQPLKVNTYKKEEIYSGPYIDSAPELFFEIEDGSYKFFSIEDEEEFFEKPLKLSGTHTKYGIVIGYGNNLKKAQTIQNAQITDLVPTILYLLGIPIPKNLDGKVLKDGIADNYLRENTIQYGKTEENERFNRESDPNFKTDTKKIEERLANLGYI